MPLCEPEKGVRDETQLRTSPAYLRSIRSARSSRRRSRDCTTQRVVREHTFFLDQHGLNIVEPVEAAEPAAECAKVVNLGSWTDDSRSGLKLHEPAVTDIVVTLDRGTDTLASALRHASEP